MYNTYIYSSEPVLCLEMIIDIDWLNQDVFKAFMKVIFQKYHF